jgi:hypothetical protein
MNIEEVRDAMTGNPVAFLSADAYPTEAARYICDSLLPEWIEHFLRKNAGYGNMHHDLGVRAQYVDINRKVGKLRRKWWDGKEIGPETDREVCLDLIGHLFLALELLDGDHEADSGD